MANQPFLNVYGTTIYKGLATAEEDQCYFVEGFEEFTGSLQEAVDAAHGMLVMQNPEFSPEDFEGVEELFEGSKGAH